MKRAILRYERLVAAIKSQLLNEHAAAQAAFARYETTIAVLQQQVLSAHSASAAATAGGGSGAVDYTS